MPPLSQAVRPLDTSRYERLPSPVTPVQVPLMEKTYPDAPNTILRCALPPLSSVTPDSLRQYYAPGMPQTRILTPNTLSRGGNSGSSAGSQIVFVGNGSANASNIERITVSGAGGVQNASVVTPNLNQGQSFKIPVTMARVFALLKVSTSAPARIRLYSSQAAQQADLGRDTTTPVVPGNETGIIADFLLLASTELHWTCSPMAMGFNDDTPQNSACYVTVTNPVAASAVLTVSFTFVALA